MTDKPRKRRLNVDHLQQLDQSAMFGKSMGDFTLSRDPGLENECIALENHIQGRLQDGELHIVVAQELRDVADRVEDGKTLDRDADGRLLYDGVMDLLDAGHAPDAIAVWLRSAADEVAEQAPELPQ